MADMANLADARKGAYRLENADTNIPPASNVIRATRKAVGVDRYSSYLPLHGLPEMRKAVSDRYSSDIDLRYDPDSEIVITSGAGEAMLDSLLALVDPGDKVLLTNPTYSGMAQRVKVAGAMQSFTNLNEENGWHLDVEDFRKAAEGCRIFFLGSPAMPTGVVFDGQETELIAETAKKNDAIALFNASFDKVVFDKNKVTNPATLDGMRDRTVVIGSVSKNYNMMGWRIGWAAGPERLIKPIENVHIFNGIMPSGINEAGAAAALSGPQGWVKKSVSVYQKRRDLMVRELSQIKGFKIVSPEGGYFFLANIKDLGVKSSEFCVKLLEEKNVATTPMVAWGADDFGAEHVRFIFTNENETRLKKAASLVRDFVKEHYN